MLRYLSLQLSAEQIYQGVGFLSLVFIEGVARIIAIINGTDRFSLPIARIVVLPIVEFELSTLVFLGNVVNQCQNKHIAVICVRRVKHRTDNVSITLRCDFQHLVQVTIDVSIDIALATNKVWLFPSEFISIVPLREIARRIIVCLDKRLPQVIDNDLILVGVTLDIHFSCHTFPS